MDHKRIALVTGANQGVGFQVAKELAKAGVTVLLGSRGLARGEAAAAQIGAGVVPVQIDVTDAASIAAAADRIRTEFGRLDLLVNNAAISNTGKGARSLEEYARTSVASLIDLDEAIEQCPVMVVLVDHELFKSVPLDERSDKLVYDTRGIWPDQPPPIEHATAMRLVG